MSKSEDNIIQEFRDEKSMELFDKPECLLEPFQIIKLDQYIYDIGHPIWKPIMINGKDSGYKISNIGTIMNSKNKLLHPSINDSGYLKIGIMFNGRQLYFKIHRLVASAFIPNPDNKREVNHINTKKIFNWVGNLEWVTPKENKQHAMKMGLYRNASFVKYGSEKSNSKYSDEIIHKVCKLLEKGKYPKEISEILGVPRTLPGSIKYSGKWKHISSRYNIPLYNKTRKNVTSRNTIKRNVENLMSSGNLSYEDLFKLLNISDNKAAKNYIYNIKHNMEKQSSTTIDQL